jgi:transposase, IS5 family
MKQQTLGGFERYGKTTRRAQFLAEMDRVVPWGDLLAVIEPVYPRISEAGGRPPVPLERMLRIYFLQAWFNLSDPAVEEALYDSATTRAFAGVDLGQEAAPDETTVCKFRHLLERHTTVHAPIQNKRSGATTLATYIAACCPLITGCTTGGAAACTTTMAPI